MIAFGPDNMQMQQLELNLSSKTVFESPLQSSTFTGSLRAADTLVTFGAKTQNIEASCHLGGKDTCRSCDATYLPRKNTRDPFTAC